MHILENLILRSNLLFFSVRSAAALLLCITVFAVGCNNSKFRGRGANNNNTPANPTDTPATPFCSDGRISVGVDVVFVIDNSGSNRETDCNISSDQKGLKEDDPNFECVGTTERENAVMQSFDSIVAAATAPETPPSGFAVVSFPRRDLVDAGFDIRTTSWLQSNANDRSALANAMLFARRPSGMTPYGAGLEGAAQMLKGAQSVMTNAASEKPKFAILISDGEPTDRDPAAVESFAQREMLQLGYKIYSILITGDASAYQQRLSHHQNYLKGLRYPQSSIDQLVGLSGDSLLEKISSNVFPVNTVADVGTAVNRILKDEITCE